MFDLSLIVFVLKHMFVHETMLVLLGTSAATVTLFFMLNRQAGTQRDARFA